MLLAVTGIYIATENKTVEELLYVRVVSCARKQIENKHIEHEAVPGGSSPLMYKRLRRKFMVVAVESDER